MNSSILLDVVYNPALGIFLFILLIPLAVFLIFIIVGMVKFYTPENQEKMLEDDERLGKQIFDWNFEQFGQIVGFTLRYKSDYRKINPDKFELIYVSDIDKFEYKSNEGMATLKCKNGNKYRLYVLNAEKKALATYLVSKIEIWKKEIENAPKKELTAEEKKEQLNTFVESLKIPVNELPPKDASVVGRAVAGGIIAGPAGAVVGALSAVDKNNKNREKKKSSRD